MHHRIAYFSRKRMLMLFFSVLACNLFPQDYDYHNFSSEQGLAQSYVYSIIQDVHGCLWIGTGNGLSRYNGFNFKNFTTKDSLADNFITCGIGDGECLWFGHMNGGVSCFNGKKFQVVGISSGNSTPVTHFAKSPDGRIWLSSYSDGLHKLDKETGNTEHYSFKDQVLIGSFDFLNDSDILAGTNTGLIWCRLKVSYEIGLIRPVMEIPESRITCIQKMKNNTGFLIATENDGIYQLVVLNNSFKVTKLIADPEFDFTGIQYIYEDSKANLWFGSFGNGLIKAKFSGSRGLSGIYYFKKDRGFAADNVKTIFEDREGNIWSGNYGKGLTLLTPRIFSVCTFNNPDYGNKIYSICFSLQFKWIGTENGLVKMDKQTGEIIKFYGKGSGLPEDKVTTIFSKNGNELWIGTDKNGVFRMNVANERIQNYPVGKGVLENSITIIAGKGEDIWIGTKKGLCFVVPDKDKIKWYSINRGGLPHNFVSFVYIDKTGRPWITTHSNILTYIQDEEVHKIPLYSGSGIFTLGPITEDSDYRIWVGSIGNGVFRIGADSIANITVKEGLLSDYCYSIISDDQGNIWIGHKDGLSRIRINDFSVKPIRHIEGMTDSYQFNPDATGMDQQGKIWFGSDRGMVLYDPSRETRRFLPPVLGITSIKINDEEKDYNGKILLSPGKYKLRIDFMGISLTEPSLVTYKYKLEGYDQLSEITKNTSITYNQLTEGTYTFILKASSGDGVVTKNPLTFAITIKKPVWKKWWFYVSTVFLLTMMIFLYIKRREYKFKIEKRILEEKVRARTHEIECQKNEIELQKNIIDKKNVSITSSIKYARHIQNAVLPPIELIDRLLPDNFILSRPKDIVSGDFYWLAEKNDKIIFAVGDCTGHGVPGAFMSLLGITLLNEIVNIQGITKSDTIVTILRENVIRSLLQSRKDITTSDGIDLALCVLDKHQKRIQYTGGMNDLVFIRDRNLEVIKADRTTVSLLSEDSEPFTLKEIECKNKDVLYLFSDGYPDQFGGEHNKKYLVRRFYDTLLEIHELPMNSQKDILEKKLNDWMKDCVQTDDITVMGIRL